MLFVTGEFDDGAVCASGRRTLVRGLRAGYEKMGAIFGIYLRANDIAVPGFYEAMREEKDYVVWGGLTGGFGALSEDAFLNDFANGVDPVRARVLYAVQGRVSETLFSDRTTVAAWRSKPSWYAISRQDRTTSPEHERFLADRMHATTIEIDSGHLSLVTHPDQVAQLIVEAARATSRSH